jgi:hypothetical protein
MKGKERKGKVKGKIIYYFFFRFFGNILRELARANPGRSFT